MYINAKFLYCTYTQLYLTVHVSNIGAKSGIGGRALVRARVRVRQRLTVRNWTAANQQQVSIFTSHATRPFLFDSAIFKLFSTVHLSISNVSYWYSYSKAQFGVAPRSLRRLRFSSRRVHPLERQTRNVNVQPIRRAESRNVVLVLVAQPLLLAECKCTHVLISNVLVTL